MLSPQWLSELDSPMLPATQDTEQDEPWISRVPLSSRAGDRYKERQGPGGWEEGR